MSVGKEVENLELWGALGNQEVGGGLGFERSREYIQVG